MTHIVKNIDYKNRDNRVNYYSNKHENRHQNSLKLVFSELCCSLYYCDRYSYFTDCTNKGNE